MSSAPTPAPAKDSTADPAVPEAVRERLDAALAELAEGSRSWSQLTLSQRARLLGRLRASVAANAEEWAEVAALSKGLDPGHPLRGEEWLSGPYAVLVALDAYRSSLRALAVGASPLDEVRTDAAPGGRVRVRAFPRTAFDRLLLSGYTGEVWLEPGVTAAEAARTSGLGQLDPSRPGGIGLVLGAGNVTSIPVLDVLYELLAHNRVVILKINPTQDSLLPVFERALAPLIGPGLLRIVSGGGDVGDHLATRDAIGHVHITGAATTFDTIVWGPSTGSRKAQTTRRRSEGRPRLTTPITAELGGVSPVIVVPGAWSAADLRYHAEHIATMRLHNSGHNCIAGQVVVVSSDWPQREAFLAALRAAYAAAPRRPVWYPRGDERLAQAASDYPDAAWFADRTRALVTVQDDDDDAVQTTEYFTPVLGVVSLPGDALEFLDAAVAHANDRLEGTLGANVLIDPVTEAALGDGLERAVAELRYGAIAINAWTALAFLIPTLTWGAYPGGTLGHVSSGIGVVHNALLLDHVERSVVRGPFRPFPRSLGALLPGRRSAAAVFTALPTPPWFVTSRGGAALSESLTRFRA